MTNVHQQIIKSKAKTEKLLAILIDPDKVDLDNFEIVLDRIIDSPANYLFIGGSVVRNSILDELILKIKEKCSLPLVLFPGNPSQISAKADAILFLSLISGRNPDFLIEQQIKAVPILKQTSLEIIPTGYILIESGTKTAVEMVSRTAPIERNNLELVTATAQAGEMLGHKFIYLEAGSGAKQPVPLQMIKDVAENITVPLIVGGGITDFAGIKNAFDSGADIVVIGTAFENNIDFFNQNL
jgi:phosphoglycerol geranylgeranyltransferase